MQLHLDGFRCPRPELRVFVPMHDLLTPPRTARKLCLAVLLLLLLSTGLLVARDAEAQSPADVAAARDLFGEAAGLARRGQWARARDLYARSLELKPSALTMYSLAHAQKESGDLVAALENYRRFVKAPPTEASAAYLERGNEAIAALEKRVARVTLRVDSAAPSTLHVTVDDVQVPRAALDIPRLVDPGRHEVSATADGFQDFNTTFTVTEGGTARVDIVFAANDRPVLSANERPMLPLALMVGGGVVAAVGLVVGVVGYSEADGVASDSPEADSARTKGMVADVMVGGGLLGAAVGLVLVVVSSDSPEAAAATHLWHDGPVSGIQIQF